MAGVDSPDTVVAARELIVAGAVCEHFQWYGGFLRRSCCALDRDTRVRKGSDEQQAPHRAT